LVIRGLLKRDPSLAFIRRGIKGEVKSIKNKMGGQIDNSLQQNFRESQQKKVEE
jgi:hypothetical protein